MIEYELSTELDSALGTALSNPKWNEFKPLRECDIKIYTCLAVKTDKEGDPMPMTGDPVTLKKLSDLHRTFIDGHYVLVACAHFWRQGNKDKRNAYIHKALSQIVAEPTEKGLKLSKRKPDVVEYTTTLVRFGAYSPVLVDVFTVLQSAAKQFSERQMERREVRTAEPALVES